MRVLISAACGLAAVAVAVAVNTAPISDQPLADDVSDYPGTSCPIDDFFNASQQQCATDVVTNDPQAPIDPNRSGTSDPGKACGTTQLYDVTDTACAPEAVTNDPQEMASPDVVLPGVLPEGQTPEPMAVPTVASIPGCAGDEKAGSGQGKVTEKDPFGLCR